MDHASFVWIPLRQHVVFQRPTPHQTLHLLRDVYSYEDTLENMRDYIARCFARDVWTDSAMRTTTTGAKESFCRILPTHELTLLQQQQQQQQQQQATESLHVLSRLSSFFSWWNMQAIQKNIRRAFGKRLDEWA
jgi:hypothetical protein